jgi:hypothetical protein
MTSTFAITAPATATTLDSGGRGEASFTVTNTTSAPARGRIRLVPLGGTKPEWLNLAGEAERQFGPQATETVVVWIATPPGTPPGSYLLRVDVAAEENPDEDFAQGPSVGFTVAAQPPAPPRKFPWWIVAVAAGGVLLIVLGVIAFNAVFGGRGAPPGPPEPPRTLVIPDVSGIQREEAKTRLETFCGLPTPCFDVRIIQPLIVLPADRFIAGVTIPPAGTEVATGSRVTMTVQIRPVP